jgi:hypothetical protein
MYIQWFFFVLFIITTVYSSCCCFSDSHFGLCIMTCPTPLDWSPFVTWPHRKTYRRKRAGMFFFFRTQWCVCVCLICVFYKRLPHLHVHVLHLIIIFYQHYLLFLDSYLKLTHMAKQCRLVLAYFFSYLCFFSYTFTNG